jgi:hypothetical protein
MTEEWFRKAIEQVSIVVDISEINDVIRLVKRQVNFRFKVGQGVLFKARKSPPADHFRPSDHNQIMQK